jgi:hypothetical protein
MKAVKMLALCAMIAPLPALAQTVPAADNASSVDPARLAAARKLIDQIVPPEKRDSMIEQIVRPMMANMRQSFEQSPEFAKMFAEQPEAKKQMLDFMDGETERSLRLTRESMPTLFDAMAVAYARRFTLDQLADIGRFFDTPTGRFYAEQAPTIMADPAVQAAQRAMMAKSLDGLQDRVKAMAEKIQASAKKGSAS